MTIKLASLKADLALEQEGDWVPAPKWDGVDFRVRSIHYPAFKTARELLLQKLARKYRGKPAPDEESAPLIGVLYAKHILLEWRGLDVPYSPAKAQEILCDPAYREILNAVEACATQIGEIEAEALDDMEKNSAAPSGIK